MPVMTFAKAFRSAALFAAGAALMTGCAVPTGTAHLYREKGGANSSNGESRELTSIYDTTEHDPAIRKAANGSLGQDDVFAIYLTDGYFKYLRDFDGVNEVVIVAEFTEVNAGTKDDTVSKVLGPYLGVADQSGTPFLSKLLYGPKKLDSDHINVRLTILEYDQGENENSAAFLDFITSASQTLSLENPVTAAEIKFAKEVAKSLLSLNKDDVVMQIDFDLVGDTGQIGQQGSYIALSPGNYVLINQERCSLGNCFGYLTHGGTTANPVTWLGDAALLIPVALRRGLTDTPDGKALSPIDLSKIRHLNQKVVDTSAGSNVFTDKTWLSFTVVKGGDATLWEKRRLLGTAEEAIQNLSKKGALSGLRTSDYQLAEDALNAARAKDLQSQQVLSFVSPVNERGEFAPSLTAAEYCLNHPATVTSINAQFYRKRAAGVPQVLGESEIKKNDGKSTPNNTCFTVGSGARTAGDYEMVAVFGSGTSNRIQTIGYSIEDPAVVKAAAAAKAAAKAAP
ncbi:MULTISPECIES: hypothetical protein [unclassified Pseudomonas]|jgi:hypothetical protein|uniref:hypothetical protein n=1 Tax=unclassified Pseudomonas TaxID=196821 RepID=UPI000A1DEA8C|nr:MULTISPECIES: hypothetical protein [unclassified Pseudomonas]